jgi:shikimate dehydrogenase
MAYGLIGERLGHSFSPMLHSMLGAYDYRLYPLTPQELPGFLENNALQGFNVTIPYKQAVMPYLTGISERAAAIGSVNTVIRRQDGSLYGDNTDCYGFEQLLGDASSFTGQKALVLGSGGASKTVQKVLTDQGIIPVVISRGGENHYGNLDRHRDAALLVNTTSVGMYPQVDASPLSLTGFDRLTLVLDLIYNPHRTRLLLDAEALGIPCRGGLLMLAAQAQEAARLWGQRDDTDITPMMAEEILKGTMNIALIGMPGCGKSKVANELARLGGRQVLDTDDLVQTMQGAHPRDIIEQEGEAAFREKETLALAEAAKQSGVIIATGGGIVTVPENLPLLRQNSRVLWIQRDLALLASRGRPLSQAMGVEELYARRQPLYKEWAEGTYHNRDWRDTARQIQEDWL